jgi:hypothetical protein
MIPGINPRMVKRTLITKSLLHPLSKKTPNGGKIIANRILKISEQVNAIEGKNSGGGAAAPLKRVPAWPIYFYRQNKKISASGSDKDMQCCKVKVNSGRMARLNPAQLGAVPPNRSRPSYKSSLSDSNFFMSLKEIFMRFVESFDAQETIRLFEELKTEAKADSYADLRQALYGIVTFPQKRLFEVLDERWKRYDGVKGISRIVVSGAGPCGLRAAIESRFMGHPVTLIELRTECSRHNILKAWQKTIQDVLSLGYKTYFPYFTPHGHAHIGTNELQLCMIKTALLIGVDIHFGRGVCGILDPSFEYGPKRLKYCVWTLPSEEAKRFVRRPVEETAELSLKTVSVDTETIERVNKIDFLERAISQDDAITKSSFQHDIQLLEKAELFEFDTLLIAEGEASRLIRNLGFDRKMAKYNEAIGIVINMEFSGTKQETKLQEFNALRMSALWQQTPLGALAKMGIELENLEYMRGTQNHFMAATASIDTLLKAGVVKIRKHNTKATLVRDNMDLDKLYELGRSIATVCGVPAKSQFRSHNGVQAFDFSCKGWCVDKIKWLESGDVVALVEPIGDALINPFWPQGLGVNRGFHVSMDACYAAHVFDGKRENMQETMRVREEPNECLEYFGMYELTDLLTAASKWTANPVTRYTTVAEMHRLRALDKESK